MRQPPIIVIINKKPYTLQGTADTQAIDDMPAEDRQQLITLLETIKQQAQPVQTATQQLADRVPQSSAGTDVAAGYKNTRSGRIGSGDVDALMAQLIMEEELNNKPLPTKKSIHKWTAIIAAIIFLLILLL